MDTIAGRRKQRASAARLLLSLHASGNLDSPEIWTWDAVDRLPAWCLASSQERRAIQLTCGALLLSPEIRFWIQKPLLSGIQQLLGDSQFEQIIEHADAMKLPREPLADFIVESGINLADAGVEALDLLLMTTGATVLKATVHESLPREMLSASLGPGIGEVTPSAASTLLKAAMALFEAQSKSLAVTV